VTDTDHPSNPDRLMAHILGVCWHSPTSDRWPCTAAREASLCPAPEDLTHGPCVKAAGHPDVWHRDEDGTEWDYSCRAVHGSGEVCVRDAGHGGHHHASTDGLGWES
jgi:hypothetical protein